MSKTVAQQLDVAQNAAASRAPLVGRLAVVMITRNRRREALRSIGHHMSLPERPELLVVDNASEDGTADAVQAGYPSVRVCRLRRNLGAAARNLGVQIVGTPYVAFSDDDSWWHPGSLEAAADILDRHASVGVVTARTLVGETAEEDPLNAELAESPLPAPASLPGPRVMGFLACAAVVRASAFLEVGGFQPRLLLGGEEELLACDLTAAGWHIVFVDHLTVHHHPSNARSAHLRRRHGIRNTLWFTWLRRPLGSALARTIELARTVPRDRISLLAAADALRGVPWLMRAREVAPPPVERDLRLLDGPQIASRARRYVS